MLGALAALPLVACGSQRPGEPSPSAERSAGSITDLPADTWVEREIQVVPGAGEVGRAPVFVRRDGNSGAVSALSASCTCTPQEGGCPVRWIGSTRRFVCPCHGGIYDERGDVLGGPPKWPLESRPARVDDGTIYVGLVQR